MDNSRPQDPAWQSALEFVHPPRHELAYWLDERIASAVPVLTGTALRSMAQNHGARRGACSVPIGLGAALALASVTNLLTSTTAPIVGLWMGLLAMALLVLGRFLWRRFACTTPKDRYLSPGRGSTSIRGGLILLVILGAPICAMAHMLLATQLDGSARGLGAYAGYQMALVIGLASAFFLPGYFAQHARRDLRRLIESNPGTRAELEDLSLSWVDPVGTTPFGPL